MLRLKETKQIVYTVVFICLLDVLTDARLRDDMQMAVMIIIIVDTTKLINPTPARTALDAIDNLGYAPAKFGHLELFV